MAKTQAQKTGAEKPTTEPAKATGKSAKATGPKGRSVKIAMRREHVVGDVKRARGEAIATVQLEPGVSLNFLVDAVRSGIAGEVAT